MNPQVARIAMVAGEASGDLLASHLIQALRARLPHAEFFWHRWSENGSRGFKSWYPLEKPRLSVLRRGAQALSRAIRHAQRSEASPVANPPDVFTGVDAPDFNLALEKALKQRGVPAIHYVSPSIWAWRGKRIHKIGASVSRVLALFPFEPALYEKENIPVSCAASAFADMLPVEDGRENARELRAAVAATCIRLAAG